MLAPFAGYGYGAQNAQSALLAPREFRDNSTGAVYVQYADGTILIAEVPDIDWDGSYIPGTRGGPGEGTKLTPTNVLWHQLTSQFGFHPAHLAADPDILEEFQKLAFVQEPVLRPYYPVVEFDLPRDYVHPGLSGTQYGATPLETLTDIFEGLGPAGEETVSPTEGFTRAVYEAIPGVVATTRGIVSPATLDALSRKLGRLKGELAQTYDPAKKSILQEQIAAVEYQIAQLKSAGVSHPETVTPFPWVPVVVGGGLVLTLLAFFATRTAERS